MDLQVEESHFNGYDGTELFFQTWSKLSPKAMILGIHGLGEHSDCYRLLAEGLRETPYQLIMSDLRGHGRSTGNRGLGTIDDYILDIKLFHNIVKDRYDLPLFFLGHSMGGLILSKYLIRNGDQGALGAILSSPLLEVFAELAAFKRKSAKILAKLTPNLTLANDIPPEKLTHNKKMVESYANDPWRHDRVSAKLFESMLVSMEYVFNQADKITLPLLMQQAGDDQVVSQKRAEEFFKKLPMKDKTQIVYDGYYHEIYNEVWRDKPYADLIKWLGKHLPENKEEDDD